MKFFIFILFNTLSYAQDCNCNSSPILKQIINCEPYIFSNGNQLKWNYDCNGSYLIFSNKTNPTTLFELEASLIELTGRLGYSSWKEYVNSFIIENRLISGCCDPSEYFLFDKISGKLIKNLGSELRENEKHIFYLYYNENLNSYFLNIFNKENDTFIEKTLPNKIISKSMKKAPFLFVNYLLEIEPIDSNQIFLNIKIYKQKNEKPDISKIKFSIN